MRRLPKKLRIILIAIVVCCGCERLGIRFGAQPLPPPVRVDQGISNLGEAEPPSPAATEELTNDETSRTDITEIIRPYTQWTLAETAADALGRMRHEAVPALVNALSDPNPIVRQRAIKIIARIGPDANTAVPALVERLRDSDKNVRIAAARALGQIGPDGKDAIPALMQALQEDD